MANAKELIGQIALTSTQAGIAFSNIPSTYRDLHLVFTHAQSTLGDVIISANGDTGTSNYTVVEVYGNGSTSGSSTFTRGGFFLTYVSTAGQGNAVIDIFDYAQTNKNKAALSHGGVGDAGITARSLRWINNSAINSLSVTAGASFLSGTTCTLYGVLG